ncbi:Ti-type conjugative transfer relaxase TraA [Caulobacter segnis]
MAIYHFSARVMGRSTGHNAVSAAAYRSGSALRDERTGKRRDFTYKTEVIHSEILAPPQAPEALLERESLWNRVEAVETRDKAQLARDIEFALPRELPRDEAIALARAFVDRQFVARGMIADLNIHWDLGAGGEAKPHAHVMLTMRALASPPNPDAPFGLKPRAWNNRALFRHWREAWADMANARLAELDLETRIDHRSLRALALDLEPQGRIGPDGRPDHDVNAERHRQIARRNGEKIITDPALGLRALTHHQAAFGEQHMVQLAQRHSDGQDQFDRVMAALHDSPDLVRLGADAGREMRFTSREMIEVEVTLETAAEALAGGRNHPVARGARSRAVQSLASADTDRPAQRRALHQLVDGPDLVLVSGYRQADRDALLSAARQAWTDQGLLVLGAAPTLDAGEALEGRTGITATSLTRLVAGWDKSDSAPGPDSVIILDQAGLIGSRQMSQLLATAQAAGVKVVLVGDPAQLHAFEAGAAFRGLAQRHGVVALAEPRRQAVAWQARASQRLAAGRIDRALGAYAKAGEVRLHRDIVEAKATIASDWAAWRRDHPDRSQMIVVHNRTEARAMNSLMRREARAAGWLGEDLVVPMAGGPSTLAAGDRVLAHRAAPELGLAAGATGTVRALTSERVDLALDDGRRVSLAFSRYRDLEPGYAVAIAAARDITVDRVHVLASPRMDRHGAYLALSRHRLRASLQASREDFAALSALTACLGQERNKDRALDLAWAFAERRGLTPPKDPARSAFEGLTLNAAPKPPATEPDKRGPSRQALLEAHLKAFAEIARLRLEGRQPLPHHLAHTRQTAARLDQVWPNATSLLRQTLGREAALLQAVLNGRFGTVLTALLQAETMPSKGRPGPRLRPDRTREPDGLEI